MTMVFNKDSFRYPELPPREEISHYECVHASYSRANDGSPNDAVIVKELIHCKDGRPPIPNLRIIKNYQRDFWVTLEKFRTHKDKKTWEELSKLRKFTCCQHELQDKAARALGTPGLRGGLRQLARSPYLYGTDVSTPVIVKRSYKDRWKADPTPAQVAVYDVETSMLSPEQEIILSSFTFKKKGILTILRSFTKGDPQFVDKVKAAIDLYIGDIIKQRGLEIEIRVVDAPAGCVTAPFERAHQWQPDYVSIFNIDFDMPKSVQALTDAGIDPNDVFVDPRVPREFRNFQYIKGQTTKTKGDAGDDDEDAGMFSAVEEETTSAKNDIKKNVVPINIHDQWHYCENQASFVFCDSMLLYKRIRIAAPNEPEYNLDYLLNKNLGIRKLNFKEADGYEKGEWHAFMQENYPVEYCVYNLFDTISVEMLDEKTKDISMSLGALLKSSEYQNYNSQPKMIADDLHFFGLKHGMVIGSTSDQMVTEVDRYSPSLRKWIVTLPAYMMADPGVMVFSDMPNHPTLIYTHNSDIDIVSTYPRLQDMLNIARETTMTELSRVEGMFQEEWRHAGIDLTGGFTNATMVAQKLFKLPDTATLLAEFEAEIKSTEDKEAA